MTHTTSKKEELRSIYRRCDVSNNGTDEPMTEVEFIEWYTLSVTQALKELKEEVARLDDYDDTDPYQQGYEWATLKALSAIDKKIEELKNQ